MAVLTLSSIEKPETLIKKNKTDAKVAEARAAAKVVRKAVCIPLDLRDDNNQLD